MPTLAHKLHLVDYFVLSFGVMVGTAWLVVMDDWLSGLPSVACCCSPSATSTAASLPLSQMHPAKWPIPHAFSLAPSPTLPDG